MAEITMDDDFGRAIADTIKACGIRSVIEVGSWDGSGSTRVIQEALRGVAGASMTCIEPNPERFAELEKRETFVPTRFINRRSVAREFMSFHTFDEVWASPWNHLARNYPRDTVKAWWDNQLAGPGYLNELTFESWDAALIDGCEFCGYDDLRLLKERVQVLMLDDVFHAFKCARANDCLRGDEDWRCIWCSAFVRNGASIWVRN